MTKRSRLKVQGPAKSRRVIQTIFLLFLGCAVAWFVEDHYDLTGSFRSGWHEFRASLSRGNPPRGTIYDRNLKQMATTLERVSAYLRTREVHNIAATVKSLGEIVPVDAQRITEQLESGTLRVWIAADITAEQEAALNQRALPGVYMQREEQRFYPNGSRAAHIIGYAEGGIGLAGVELYYDHLLSEQKLALQKADKPVVDSQELVLTLDLKIQEMVEEVLAEVARTTEAQLAMSYLLENGTGEIIAAAHIPTFDPNNFTQVSPEILNNRFLEVLPVPPRFRHYLRDISRLYGQETGAELPWSVATPAATDHKRQQMFLDVLGFRNNEVAFYHGSEEQTKEGLPKFSAVVTDKKEDNIAPHQMAPMALLDGFATLLSGKITKPAVVKKMIAAGSGQESPVLESAADEPVPADKKMMDVLAQAPSLLRSLSVVGSSGACYFEDDILTVTGTKWSTELAIFKYILVSIPVGGHDLTMLMVLQKSPEGVAKKVDGNIFELIDEKIPRIIILQQVSRTVADVREREDLDLDNIQVFKDSTGELDAAPETSSEKPAVLGIMPDLSGMSLRKSLRMIQGMPLQISIIGTGRVVSQKPPPGTPIKETTSCLLTLRQGSEDPMR